MSETKTLFALGMFALIFNTIIFGVSAYVNEQELFEDLFCETITPSNETVITIDELKQTSSSLIQCTTDPNILGAGIFIIIGTVNLIVFGAIIYLFIPFVK